MKRRTFCLGALLTAAAPALPAISEPIHGTLYKDPQCGCCEGYAAYLRQNGFAIDIKPTHDLAEISQKAGVPSQLQRCHTMFLGDYVVDGHVPVNVIRKLLSERPQIAGITLPGMPTGSPAKTGAAPTVYAVE